MNNIFFPEKFSKIEGFGKKNKKNLTEASINKGTWIEVEAYPESSLI